MAKFDDPKQVAFIALLQQGFTRSDAARRVGVSPDSVRHAIRMGCGADGLPLPDTFAASVKAVEDECIERIENKLYQAAENGEPWAIQMWLKGKARDTWAEKAAAVNVNVGTTTINIEGSSEDRLATIAKLQDELEARRGAIDVPSTVALPPASADAQAADTEDV